MYINKNGLIIPKFTKIQEIENNPEFTEDFEPIEPLQPEEQDREAELDYLQYDNDKRENYISEEIQYEDYIQAIDDVDYVKLESDYINNKKFNF
jgi:hypothetical protein